jgi:hypothetical protein
MKEELHLNNEEDITTFRMLCQHAALGLEIKSNMKRRGRSVYAIVKEQYDLKGSRVSVLSQLGDLIDTRKHKRNG